MRKHNIGAPPTHRILAGGYRADGAVAHCELSAADRARLRLRMTERRVWLVSEIRGPQGRGEPTAEALENGARANTKPLAGQRPAPPHRLLELLDIEAALRRMDEGNYGICAGCGRAIEQERILVLPTTTRCRLCEERRHIASAGPVRGSIKLGEEP